MTTDYDRSKWIIPGDGPLFRELLDAGYIMKDTSGKNAYGYEYSIFPAHTVLEREYIQYPGDYIMTPVKRACGNAVLTTEPVSVHDDTGFHLVVRFNRSKIERLIKQTL